MGAVRRAGLVHGDDLVEDVQVVAGQERAAVDDHVDLVGAGRRRRPDVGELDVQAGPAGGERRWRRWRRGCRCPLPRPLATRPGRGRRRPPRPRGTVGSAGSGRMALAHSARTLPGVSWPSRVVRSIIEIARSSAQPLAVVLIDRVASTAARASAPTWSTPGSPCRNLLRSGPAIVTVVTGSPSALLIPAADLDSRASSVASTAWTGYAGNARTPLPLDELARGIHTEGERGAPGRAVARRRGSRGRLGAACLGGRPLGAGGGGAGRLDDPARGDGRQRGAADDRP